MNTSCIKVVRHSCRVCALDNAINRVSYVGLSKNAYSTVDAVLAPRQEHLRQPQTSKSRRSSRSPLDSVPTARQRFSTSHHLLKKGNKAPREEKPTPTANPTPSNDPFEFSTLESEIATTLSRLKDDLSKLRAGGRFNPEILENLRVQPDKNSTEMVKLGDLAQIIPKGRTVQILVGEKEHVKPISTAILTSRTLNPSLTPQPDPTGQSSLLLILQIPPPTTESRRAVVAEAAKAGEKASTAIRDARGKQQKKLRSMEKDRSVRPDDLRKASSMMEKLVEKGQAEVKRITDGARRVLESG